MPAKKSLGQHWLNDRSILEAIVDFGGITKDDTVLEIGPGQGSLTSVLLRRAKQVVAVEVDPVLAAKLPGMFPGKRLSLHRQDILAFNLNGLPPGYKVAANLPYYLTGKIIRLLLEAANPPQDAVLLVQKEVAERLAAGPGELSLSGVAAQFYCRVSLGPLVNAELFSPPPKVDSRAVRLLRRRPAEWPHADPKTYFKVVKAGFSAPRKQLRSSLAGGLRLNKDSAAKMLLAAGINPSNRPGELSLKDWARLTEAYLKVSF